MNAIMIGEFPPSIVKYKIGEEEFDWYYLLTDGIYPRNYKIFILSVLGKHEMR